MAMACRERDINALLERPVATTVADAQQIAAAEERSRAQVGVCFQNRYNATARALHDAVQSRDDVLGAVATVTWFRDADYRQRPWRGRSARAGGGALVNEASTPLTCCCGASATLRMSAAEHRQCFSTRPSKWKTPRTWC